MKSGWAGRQDSKQTVLAERGGGRNWHTGISNASVDEQSDGVLREHDLDAQHDDDGARTMGAGTSTTSTDMADAAGGMAGFDLQWMASSSEGAPQECQVTSVSDAYWRVHSMLPQTTACAGGSAQYRRGAARSHMEEDDGRAGLWAMEVPVHTVHGPLRGMQLAPESIPESMPSVESYGPSSLAASQDGHGLQHWDFAVGTPPSCTYMRMPTPPLSDTSNEGSARDAQTRALGAASTGMHVAARTQTRGASQEVPDAATPLRAAKEMLSRRRHVMHSTNRRKRCSSDANAAPLTRSAELARSAALMVAAPGSSIHVEHPSATSVPLEDSVMGSMSGSTRLSSVSEPLTGSHKRNASLAPSRVSGGSRSRWQSKGLRTRMTGNHRTSHRRSVPSEASSECSPGLRQSGTGTAAALVPPMTAMEGPLTLLPNCPVAQHHAHSNPSHAGLLHAHCIWETEAGYDAAVEAEVHAGDYAVVLPHDPRQPMPAHGLPHADAAHSRDREQVQPSLNAAQAEEWAAGELAGLNLGVASCATHSVRMHWPPTPRGSPRSPSPQRICRRQEVASLAEVPETESSPCNPFLTPRAQTESGFESVYSGQPCARSRMAGVVAGRHPHTAEGSKDAKKMQVAMYNFERELRGRLVANGVEEISVISQDTVPGHRAQMMSVRRHSTTSHVGTSAGYMQERRLSERQFDDKERLEESTLSALAACMHRRLT